MISPSLAANAPQDLRAYAYSYPHKSSYRALTPPIPIAEAWKDENVEQLSMYVHLPFCEMRCGFCNLFTQSQPSLDTVQAYLDTLMRQARVIRESVPQAIFSQFAVGGGTPTFLSAAQLESLFTAIQHEFGLSIASLPTSVETSPLTATPERMAVLKNFGVRRISIGVQSFESDELRSFGRPQQLANVYEALETIRQFGFPILNVDLIYGSPEQTPATWSRTLREALRFEPTELYLYPLYIRPETGLARVAGQVAAHRRDLYKLAREFLLSQGYRQLSLRCFSRSQASHPSTYACQRDGMIGLGCGARSYTHGLHYATRFAVRQAGIKAILAGWIGQTDAELALATHGMRLSRDEQRRRFVIMSLLQSEGLDLAQYRQLFGATPCEHLGELNELRRREWLDESTPGFLRLTEAGLENSDLAGPLLYSEHVRRCLEVFAQQ